MPARLMASGLRVPPVVPSACVFCHGISVPLSESRHVHQTALCDRLQEAAAAAEPTWTQPLQPDERRCGGKGH